MTDNDPRDGCYGSTITHRLPTVDDVGHDCEVICTVARQRIYDDDLLFVHFNEVLPGEPWMPKRKYDNRLLNNAATNPPMTDTAAHKLLPGYRLQGIRYCDQQPTADDADEAGYIEVITAQPWDSRLSRSSIWRPFPWLDNRPCNPLQLDKSAISTTPQDPPNLTPAQIIAIRNKLLEQLRKWTPEYTADNAIGDGYCTENFLRIDWQKALQCIESTLP